MSAIFDRTAGQRLTAAVTLAALRPNFTVAWWEKRSAFAALNYSWSFVGVAGPQSLYFSSTNFRGHFNNGGSWPADRISVTPDAGDVGSWVLCVVRRDSATNTVKAICGAASNTYTDATNVSSSGGLETGATSLCIGASPAFLDPFDGRIAHVACWMRALSDAEITELQGGASPSDISSADQFFYYPLTDGTALANEWTPAAGYSAATLANNSSLVTFDAADNPAVGSFVPTISGVTPSTLTAGSNPVIAGTNFEATQGTGTVKLSPTDDVDDVNAVTQTIAASGWSDTEITLDGVSFPTGTSHNDTLYLFVTNDTGDSNAAGEAVTAYIAPTLTSPTAVSIGTTTVTPRVTTDTGNGTCYYVITPQAESEPSNTQVEAGTNAADGSPVASGSQVVSASGVITFSEVTGLTAGTAYRISYAHSGTPS